MPQSPCRVKPSHYAATPVRKWIEWSYGEINISTLQKFTPGQTKNIQGLEVYALFGGLTSAKNFWRWDCVNGFTDGEYSNGTSPE